jgi:NADP-dependent 3-hydroxy acid dehydrogenase YdfG
MRNLDKEKEIRLVVDKENIPLKTLQLDVTDSTSVNNAIKSIMDETGRIDVLVNNAGYGLVGAFEELSIEEIKQTTI